MGLPFPRPTRFIGFISLPLGAEIILYTLLFNKLTGVYGILALVTGYSLTVAQLGMYLSALAVFILTLLLLPDINRNPAVSSSAILATALYAVDGIVNAAATVLFGVNWFSRLTEGTPGAPASPANATAAAATADADAAETMGADPLDRESYLIVSLIAASWTIRLYFMIVMFAFAREAVREGAGMKDDEGWKGKCARAIVRVWPGLWESSGRVGEGSVGRMDEEGAKSPKLMARRSGSRTQSRTHSRNSSIRGD